MLKKINRILRVIGFNLVHAKKARTVTARAPRTVRAPRADSTHYVGDDCIGGHRGTACEVQASQPSSVNDITGPTS